MPVGPRVLDQGLAALASECDAIMLCSAQPSTYAEASTTLALGGSGYARGGAFGSPVANGATGRRTTSVAITNGLGSADGTATHWAAIDTTTSRLLAWGPIATPFQTAVGKVFRLPPIRVVWPSL